MTKHSLYFVCSLMVRLDLSYYYSYATHGFACLHVCSSMTMLAHLQPLPRGVKRSVNFVNVVVGSRPCIKRIVNWAWR